MKIIIFGGTTEGRKLSAALAAAGARVTVCVVSDYGSEEQQRAACEESFKGSIIIDEGRKDEEQICRIVRNADLCIDATHPFAVMVSDNIRSAAGREGVELIRLSRDRSDISSDIILVSSAEEAAEAAAEAGSRILLTTGSKDLEIYGKCLNPENLFPRILPMVSGIEKCERAEIPHRNIIAIQGPFSEELNRAVIKEYDIEVMITKDSGSTGGFQEKLNACRSCGIPAVVISRPEEDGLPYDKVLEVCRGRIG